MNYPHIRRYLEKIRGITPGAREFVLTTQEAQGLHTELTRLLLDMQHLQELAVSGNNTQEVVQVQLAGGDF